MLIIEAPDTHTGEREYVLSVLLDDFLGLPWRRIPVERRDVRITLEDQPGEIRFPDVLLSVLESEWLAETSMPRSSLPQWDTRDFFEGITLVEPVVPVIYGDENPVAGGDGKAIVLPVDIFGSAFFLLSRYEEVVRRDRDEHERFPATSSTNYVAGFLDRAIVDEYTEILWTAMKHLWPRLSRMSRRGKMRVTCDVDRPFDCRIRDLQRWLARLGGDILVRRDIRMAHNRFRNRFAAPRGDFRFDPYYTFDWYMDACERAGHRAAFYFIPGHSSQAYDSCYDLGESVIRDLIQGVARRGHEVGVHGSYNTFRDPARIIRERRRMIATCRDLGIDNSVSGNRQHYLRWDARETPDHLDAAGFEYDTSGGFADRPGFRYGTSRSFPMWSWKKNAPLSIVQRPLILMEGSVIDDRYLGMGNSRESMELMLRLKRHALAYGGDFTLLWHNSSLTTPEDRAFFQELIA